MSIQDAVTDSAHEAPDSHMYASPADNVHSVRAVCACDETFTTLNAAPARKGDRTPTSEL